MQFVYVVTARHCIEATQGREFHIRINAGDGYDDLPTRATEWFQHPSADVAAILWPPPAGLPSGRHYDLKVEGLRYFISANHDFPIDSIDPAPGSLRMVGEVTPGGQIESREALPVGVGDEVIFLSLLSGQPGEDRNLPVARFGHVSRLPAEPILMRSGGSNLWTEAYLAECHSWGGHSGSPCYWLHPYTFLVSLPDPRPEKEGETMLVPHDRQVIALLGLVSAHWEIPQRAKTTGSVGDAVGEIRMALNAGIAVVTPAEKIRELLMNDHDAVSDRVEKAEEARQQH